jgi:hypothetical protein
MRSTMTKKPWMRSELTLLDREYRAGGAKRAGKGLPHRTIRSIYVKAAELGLRRPGERGRPTHA